MSATFKLGCRRYSSVLAIPTADALWSRHCMSARKGWCRDRTDVYAAVSSFLPFSFDSPFGRIYIQFGIDIKLYRDHHSIRDWQLSSISIIITCSSSQSKQNTRIGYFTSIYVVHIESYDFITREWSFLSSQWWSNQNVIHVHAKSSTALNWYFSSIFTNTV